MEITKNEKINLIIAYKNRKNDRNIGGRVMARCPYLDYESHGYFGNSNDKYICKLTGQKMDVDDTKVKYACKADYGDKYEDCQVYRDKR